MAQRQRPEWARTSGRAPRTWPGVRLWPGVLGSLLGCSEPPARDPVPTVSELVNGPLAGALTLTASWDGGYCANLTACNTGEQTVTWSATVAVAPGRVNQAWNARFTTTGTQARLSGLEWNASLAAGGSTSFGFCSSGSSSPRLVATDVSGGTARTSGTGGTGGTGDTGGSTGSGGTAGGGATRCSPDRVGVYADGHYGGTRVCLAAGRYDLRALAQSGVKNDSVSSVQVPSSYSALPYEHDAFSGRELVVVSDTPKLPANTFDNRLSSSVVVKVGVVDPSTRRPLRAVGNKVVDGTGRTVRLRGVNIAGLEWSRTGEQMDRSIDEAVKVWKANVVGATTRLGCAELGDSFEECRCV